VKKGWIEFAPAPESLNDGDWVSHVALSAPPVVEHAVLEAGGLVGAVCAAGTAVVAVVAVVVEVAAPAVLGAVVAVVLVEVSVLVAFFLAALGVDEPHAPATTATATNETIRVDPRGTRTRPR